MRRAAAQPRRTAPRRGAPSPGNRGGGGSSAASPPASAESLRRRLPLGEPCWASPLAPHLASRISYPAFRIPAQRGPAPTSVGSAAARRGHGPASCPTPLQGELDQPVDQRRE